MAWNLSAAIKHLVSHASSSSNHQCAKYVRMAIEAGGLSTAGRPVSACDYKNFLPTIGFKAIGKIHGKSNQVSWTNRSARPGDIAVMDHGVHGHICMYSGQRWISDFVQNNMWVYGGDGTCYIFRYNGEIDPTLDAYIDFNSTGLKYIVPLDQQLDHICIENIGKFKYNILSEILESSGAMNLAMNNHIEYENLFTRDDSSVSQSIVSMGLFWTDSGDAYYENSEALLGSGKFVDYKGPADGSIGSKDFPQGKGKCIAPFEQYWPFYTFGFGASPRKRPTAAFSKRSGVDCCKLAIDTIMGYLKKGCKTIGDVICMYHAGMPTYDKFLQYYTSRKGINDIADGRYVSSEEMIKRQNYYQQHLVDYVHMSNKTPLTRSYKVLFPLITFISRQEQGVNCEEACKQALQEMNIT